MGILAHFVSNRQNTVSSPRFFSVERSAACDYAGRIFHPAISMSYVFIGKLNVDIRVIPGFPLAPLPKASRQERRVAAAVYVV